MSEIGEHLPVNIQSEHNREGELEIGEAKYIEKFESSIPRNITNAIFSREQLPQELPPPGSSIFEDFITDKLKSGIGSPKQIADSFVEENITGRIKNFVHEIRDTSERIKWDEVFTIEDTKNAQEKALKEMRAMGMTEKQIDVVSRMGVDITKSEWYSSLTEESIHVSRLQAVRKALEYIKVFGDEVPFEQVVKGRIKSTIGHELGHKVDDVAGTAVNKIPTDKEWDKGEDNAENRRERFAEFWAGIAIADNTSLKQMREREWLIHLNKVTRLWDAVANYNKSHEQKTDLNAIFRDVEEKLDPNDLDVASLFRARITLYDGNEIENYASPYPREIVAKAVKPKNNLT